VTDTITEVENPTPSSSAPRAGAWRRLLTNPVAVGSMIVLALLVIVAVLSPWITPYPPNATSLDAVNAPPSPEHWLGGDRSGRDILSRLIAGAYVTVESAIIATSVAMILGVTAGLIAGYYGKTIDSISSWLANILIAVPGIIILIALYAAVGSSTRIAMVALGILMAPNFFRLTRGLVIGVRKELYVDAARVSGLGDVRIVGRHVLSAVRAPVIVQAAFAAGVAISLQAGLAFLGLSDSKEPSWGGMLQEGFANLYVAPLQIVWPGLALGVTVSAFVLLGNSLRDTLEGARPRPKKRGERSLLARAVEQVSDESTRLLHLEKLSIAYPIRGGRTTVVHDVSLEVNRGEIVGLVGESGSGKSQTAFSILGLLPAEAIVAEGSMTFFTRRAGLSPNQLLGRSIAYIPQEPMSNLDPSFTVGAQLVYGIRAGTGKSRREAKKLALALLGRVGIPKPTVTFGSYPHEISGGMAQRVLIAGAVASEPELLIADEPTTALDVTVQAEILELLRGLQKERGMGVLLVTHNFGVVADLCDRVVVMRHGRVVETGETLDVFEKPQAAYTKELLDAILDVDVVRERPAALEQADKEAASR